MTGSVAVAVCTYRRPAGLARLLATLPEGCGARWPVPVFVIDNDGHDPEIVEIVAREHTQARADIRLVVEPSPGISAARNRALAEAEAAGIDRLAMLDDDEWPLAGWLEALLARQTATGAAITGGIVRPHFPASMPRNLRRLEHLWSVRPQSRGGAPFVHATSNVLLDLTQLRDVLRPIFDPAFGLSGGSDLVAFSRLARLGKPMAWAEDAVAIEAIPPARATLAWLRQRRFRVGNHMALDDAERLGGFGACLRTAGLLARLPVYPLLGREAAAPLLGWRLETAKIRGRLAAHRGLKVHEYARDGVRLRAVGDTAPAPARVAPEEVIVGIPTLNEAAHIEACLRDLIEGDPWMAAVRVIVADGGSRDGTVGIVGRLAREFPNLGLRHNPDRFQSAALNLVAGLAEPGHRYLVRCDAHAGYPPGYVRACVERLAALPPDAASVTTVLDATGEGGFADAAAWVVDTPLGSGGSAHRGGRRSGWVHHAHHAAFRLDWLRRVGGYDAALRWNEDAELDHRLRAAGGRIWLAAEIRVRYRMREGLGALARQYFNYGRGRAATLVRHRERPRLRQLLPAAHLTAQAAAVAGSAVQPWLLVVPASYAAALAGVSLAGLAARRRLAGLWAGPALAMIHNAWAFGFIGRLAAAAARRAVRPPAPRAARR
jgi:succinoglycan biosynthesis protein ExoA